jgi:hypothetical protein
MQSKEHIIPKWLIDLTGDLKRKIPILFVNEQKRPETRDIPFDSLTIQACEDCNNKFSNLERETKIIINNLLIEKPLSSNDFKILLNWFDKIRIGLFLTALKISRNPFGINPNFYIISRLCEKDRLLFIYKIKNDRRILNIIGSSNFCFHLNPSCLGIFVNNFILFNESNDFLFSKEIGFPYPRKRTHYKNGRTLFDIGKGKRKISYPILPIKYNKRCTKIFQPLIRKEFFDTVLEYYENVHVKKYMDEFENGIGKILYCKNNKLNFYPHRKSNVWIPKETLEFEEVYNIIIQILKHQNYFIRKSQELIDENKEVVEIHRRCCKMALMWSNANIKNVRDRYLFNDNK